MSAEDISALFGNIELICNFNRYSIFEDPTVFKQITVLTIRVIVLYCVTAAKEFFF